MVPQQIHIIQHKLPTMTDKDDVKVFLRQLDIAIRTAHIPQDKWKQHLLSQLTLQVKQQVIGLLEDEDSDYDVIKQALLGRHTMTFTAAAEAFFTADKGEILNLPTQQVGDKLVRWLEKIAEGADADREKYDKIAMGAIRSFIVPELKNYNDLAKPTNRAEFDALTEQWVRSKPFRKSMYRMMGGYKYSNQASDTQKYNHSSTTSFGSSSSYKKPLTCYACGKVGHMSRECRSKPLETHKQTSTSISPTDVKPIICFTCSKTDDLSAQKETRIRSRESSYRRIRLNS